MFLKIVKIILIYIKVISTIINSFILKFKFKKSPGIKEYIYYNFTKYI